MTVFAIAVLGTVVGCTPSVDASDRQLPLALIYAGPQGCDDCAPTIARLLQNAPHPFRTRFVGPGTDTPLTKDALVDASLYVQPGGGQDLQSTWADLAGSADDLRAWIRAGGSYLGLCFGAYLAGADPGFALLSAPALGYTDTPGARVTDERDAVVDVTYRGHARHMHFQDGPAFAIESPTDANVLATYSNGYAAVMAVPYGKGMVGVSGPHPEADQSWYDGAELVNPDGVQPDIAYDLVATTTRR